MAIRFLKLAAAYLLLGVTMGFGMGITHQFQYAPVHAHVNLLGWATQALVALIYRVFPQAAETRLARLHFGMHNLGLPVFMASLFLVIAGQAWAQAGVAVGAAITLTGIALFVVNLARTLDSRALSRADEPIAP